MTLTADVLRTGRYHRLAYVLIFEGVGLAFTTDADVAGLAAAWAGSDWQLVAGKDPLTAQWYTGLFYPEEWTQGIEPFAPRIRADDLKFKILDPLGTLALMLGGSARSPASCYLTADMDAVSSALVTTDTASFATAHPAGSYLIYVGNETILANAANRTANGWSSSTRGAYSIFDAAGGTPFVRPHRINKVNGLAPKVTDTPRTWFNRGVALYLHHYEEGVGWNDDSEALLVWSGRVKSFTAAGRAFDFTARTLTEMLNTQVMADQFVAKVSEGTWITPQMSGVYVREYLPAVSRQAFNGVLPTTNAIRTASQVMQEITSLLRESNSAVRFGWGFGQSTDGRVRVQFTVKGYVAPQQPEGSYAEIGLHPQVWKLLGFAVSGTGVDHEVAGNTYHLHVRRMIYTADGGAKWSLFAEQLPIVYDFARTPGTTQKIAIEAVRGAWKPQDVIATADTPPALAEGFVDVGGLQILQGYYVGPPTNQFVVTQDKTAFFKGLGFSGAGGVTDGFGDASFIRQGEPGDLEMRQVWWEQAPVRQLAQRLILSCGGTFAFNGPFDQNPAGMGCEIPLSIVDTASFNALGEADKFSLLLNQPTECSRILESLFATYGRHLVWKAGKLTLVEPKMDGPSIAVAYTLNENNKAVINEPAVAVASPEGLINRVEIKYDRAMDGSFRRTWVLDDLASQSDFGQSRALEIQAWGIGPTGEGVDQVLARAAAKPLAYFSRPLMIVERSIDKTLIQIVPGDTVLLTDNELIDPRTGLRGLVNYPCWVLSTSFDFARMRGKVQLAYSAELYADKICAWGPTARVDHTAANAGYVVVSGISRYLACNPFLYSAPPAELSVSRFNAGDVLSIRELSPVDPYAPLGFSAVVQSVDTVLSRIYLTAVIVGWDTTKKYIIQAAGWSAPVQQAQKRDVFVAGLTDSVEGPSIPTAYLWGAQHGQSVTAVPFAAQKFVRPPRSRLGDWLWRQGSPLAVGDYYELLYSLNSMLAHRTKQQAHMGAWTHGAAVTASAARELLAGPAQVPLYGWGRRPIRVRIFAKTGGATGTIYLTTSRTMPKGLTNAAVLFDDDVIGFSSFTLNNAAYAWSAEQIVPCYPNAGFSQGFGPPFVWLTVEGQIASGAINIQGISAGEGGLP